MDYYDFLLRLDQNFFSAFGGTEKTTGGKKATTNHFDSIITPFNQVMARYFPFADESETRNGERITFMTHLVEKMNAETALLKQQIINAQQSREAADNAIYDVKLKCLDIAFRIRDGGIVSVEDLNFLRENDPELYFSAMNP